MPWLLYKAGLLLFVPEILTNPSTHTPIYPAHFILSVSYMQGIKGTCALQVQLRTKSEDNLYNLSLARDQDVWV